MKAEIITLTPQKAKELLSRNKNNRPLSELKCSEYTYEMKNGRWKENGAPIIIDKSGVMKDGQHRCEAVIRSHYTYRVPLVTDVACNTMDTIDIGKKRSAADVLKIMGYTDVNNRAAVATVMAKVDRGISYSTSVGSGNQNRHFTNSYVVNYYVSNKDAVDDMLKTSQKIQRSQPVNLLSTKKWAALIYMITRGDIKEEHMDFFYQLSGAKRVMGNSCAYVYSRLVDSKKSSTNLSNKWFSNMVIKAWNNYVNGDPQVSWIKYSDNEGDIQVQYI